MSFFGLFFSPKLDIKKLEARCDVTGLSKILTQSRLAFERHDAVVSLGKINDVRVIEPLIKALDDPDSEVSEAATRALVRLGTAAVEPLVFYLRSWRSGTDGAARALGEIGDKRAVEPLVKVLEAHEGRVGDVIRALGKIGDARAVESLSKTVGRGFGGAEKGVPEAAIQALGKIGNVRAAEGLVKTLITLCYKRGQNREETAVLIEMAEGELVKLGSVAVEPLVAGLTSMHESLRGRAAHLLGLLGWRPTDDAQRAVLAVASGDWEEVVKLGAIAVEPLVNALRHGSTDLRVEVARTLGRIGDTRAVAALISALRAGWSLGYDGTVAVFNGLRTALEHNARYITTDQLRAILEIPWKFSICWDDGTAEVDHTDIGQLFQDELIRREEETK